MQRLHKVLKNSPALNLRIWLYAIGQGFSRLSGSLPAKQLYLATAQGGWLDEWGTLYGIARAQGENDTTYRARIIANALGGNNDTLIGLANDLTARTGVSCTVKLGSSYVVRNGAWQTVRDNGLFGSFDPTDVNTGLQATKQVYYESGAYGPAGIVVFPNAAYSSALMSKVVAVLLDDVTPGVVWDISWTSLAAPPRGEYGLRKWKRIDSLENTVSGFPALPLFVQQ